MKNIIKKTDPKDIRQISSDYALKQTNYSTLEAYALKNGSKGIKAVRHTTSDNAPVWLTVRGNRRYNGWYSISFLKNLNLIGNQN